MLNRYYGNTGRVERIDDSPPGRDGGPYQARNSGSCSGGTGGFKNGPLEQLLRLIPENLGKLETDDIIILLILYLMYRESGDIELLIIMGAMFLL
jgi:hypothetical protein